MNKRIRFYFYFIIFLFFVIIGRLFYWQIVKADTLKLEAKKQRTAQQIINPDRGKIFTSDGFPLVINQPRYDLVVYTPNLKSDPATLAQKIVNKLSFSFDDPAITTDSAKLKQAHETAKQQAYNRILHYLTDRKWAILAKNLSSQQKKDLANLDPALSFQEYQTRFYPEASMSAHLTGFLGKNKLDQPTGYFGLEGYYNLELKGDIGRLSLEKDIFGRPLFLDNFQEVSKRNGRDLVLYLDHTLQYIAQSELQEGVKKYGAQSGEVIMMDPNTGGILALATYPTYDPSQYWRFPTSLYKNPVIADTYEPGSTFKVLVMAAALEEAKVHLEDHCDICGGPVKIGKYFIKTWDNKYQANRTPAEIIIHSDNTGMVWVQRRLGGKQLLDYIKKFGFGHKTGIDLQEEVSASLKKKWSEIDYATASFGQGIAVTSIQMVRAVAALANGGKLLEPHVVKQIIDRGKVINIPPKVVRRVVSPQTTRQITNMMVRAVNEGEAKWTRLPGYNIAGKTGTAQIPIANHYDDKRTIASFIGFAPADNPRFVMLVKLYSPTTSPWGSETAAPLWFAIAKQALLHFNIPPTNTLP